MRKHILGLALGFWLCLMPAGGSADQQPAERVRLAGTVFDQGSATLRKAALPSLQPLLRELQADPRLRISIECRTAATGWPDKDLALSRKRAQTVSNWLVAQGIDASRVQSIGLGSGSKAAASSPGPAQEDRIDIVKTRALYPAAVFPSSRYAFDPVVDGTEVRHDFKVRNTGTAELEIRDVKTG